MEKLMMKLLALLVCVGVPSVYSRNITAFTTREGDLNHIVIHNVTGRIYVGAVNGIFQLNSNMQFEFEYKTGPQLENVQCLPESDCEYFHASRDNVNKILLIDYEKEFLLACGSAIQGTCTIHSLDMINPIEDHIYSEYNIEYDFVATEGSVVAFFAPAPPNPLAQEFGLGLYIGATRQTHRPVDYITQKAVSTKRLHLTNGRYNFQYAYYDANVSIHTYIDFLSNYRDTYKINYVHGFSHDGFSYFLTVQRIIAGSAQYETRIVRICQKDKGYYSYTEMPLKCQNGNKTRNFNILQAAYVGPVGMDLATYLNINSNDLNTDVILGVFASSVNQSTDIPSRNTAVCAFTMKSIASKFRKGLQSCFDGQGTQGLRFFSEDAICMHSTVIVDNNFCGDSFNSPIEVKRSYNSIDLLQGGGRMVPLSSINAMPYGRRTVVFMGTKDGELLHYILRPIHDEEGPPPPGSYSGRVFAYRNQTMDPPGPIIQDMPYSLDMQYIFVGTPQTLFRVPIHDCSQYRDCSTCVTTEDPVVCGWCGSYCSTSDECSGTGIVWSQSSCPPAIYEISPLSGPLGGGTELTLTGDNLGIGIIMAGGTHSIHLPGGAFCIPLPDKSNIHVITCITEAVGEPTNGVISVTINVASDILSYTITGIATSTMQFSYVDPIIVEFYPPYGPISGGTTVSIYGTNLSTGNSREVMIAGDECEITRVKDSEITCVTLGAPDMVPMSSTITIIFDSDTTKSTLEEYYYIDDPVIYDIQPKKVFLSGGLTLNVFGTNLHIIMEPLIVVTVYMGSTFHNYDSVCTPNPNGTMMTCDAPNISSSGVATPATVDVAFILDNVDNALQMDNSTGVNDTETDLEGFQIDYVTDPIYYKFKDTDNIRQLKDHTYPLEIMGDHLNLAATPSDVLVTVGSSVCNITELLYTMLRCDPPELHQGRSETDAVTVTVGNLQYDIGRLLYIDSLNNSPKYWHYILVTASSCIVMFVIVVVLIMLYKRRLRTKQLMQNEPVVHFRPETYRLDSTTSNMYTENPSFRQREKKPLLSIISTEMRMQIQEILIPEDSFVIENIIGKGHFGSVYQGSHKTKSGEVNEIAIKCLLPGSAQQDMVHFLQEGMMMKDFKHENVLALIGVCINKEGVPLVILPFMKHGDLLTYIRDPKYDLTARELLVFSLHIACGMSYLASLKFVHRDLAARNCMLDETLTVKVADFGLSRDIYERDYYSAKDKNAKLPVRWMALECLERNIYNTKTDVWSFGVVMWEMLTRGITPYPAVDNWDINRYLAQGRRLPQPQFCPDEVYHIMQQCWAFSPQSRPSFDGLAKKLSDVLESSPATPTSQDTYVYVNVPRNESYTLATKNEHEPLSSFVLDGYMAMASGRSAEQEEAAPTPYAETPIHSKLPLAHQSKGQQETIKEDIEGYLKVSPH
ncbi:hepatocyte growth factor receptor-like isoform X3 [Anneissia japonica]|uniref:hepatocyte growth factor receptor-like isoform X3 n=1 Tax=Anneissia japonica TaxID=1529436 RepID=UPI00142591BD|nr:hepatocyte growth factor receptor-like isoform X3 [Anneissia japonica]